MSARLTTEQWVAKAVAVHGDKYEYSLANYKDAKTLVVVTCKDHGDWNCNPSNHVKLKNARGCPYCGGSKHKTPEDFVSDALQVHGVLYDYTEVKYVNSQTHVTIVCAVHGPFQQTPTSHLSGAGCRLCGSTSHFDRVRGVSLSAIKKRLFAKCGTDISIIDESFKNINAKANFVCKVHGQFCRLVSAALYRPNICIHCYHESSQSNFLDQKIAEKRLFSVLLESEVSIEPFEYKGKNDTTLILNCPKHGKWKSVWSQVTRNHGSCPKCLYEASTAKRIAGINKHNKELRDTRWANYLKKFKEAHGELYDYSKAEFVDAKKPIEIICTFHGSFMQPPDSHTIAGCRLCANEELAGLYNERYFKLKPEMASIPATLYLLKLHFNGITCFKLGITRTSLKRRFGSALGKGVKIEVIATRNGQLFDVWRDEVKLLSSSNFEKFEIMDPVFAREARISTNELVSSLPDNWHHIARWTSTEQYLL